VSGEIVVIADVDAFWSLEALRETVKWFADERIGAVSCLKNQLGQKSTLLKKSIEITTTY